MPYKNKEDAKRNKREYYLKNREKDRDRNRSDYFKDYYQKNKKIINEKTRDWKNEYDKNRRRTDINFRIKCALRSRFGSLIRHKNKTGSAVQDLGCSVSEFIKYIEQKFSDGMTWENYGEWHFDHIKPLSSFNLENRDELLQACHYSNIQPLWAIDNLKKGSRICS